MPVPTGVSFQLAPLGKVRTSFRIGVSRFPVNSSSPIAGLKTCNYLEQMMAFSEARSAGLDEAIRINERGHVTSACMANVFWSKGQKLFTPALTTGCLPGTTRAFVLDNIDCEHVETGVDSVEEAEAVYLSSAGLGVVSVDGFNGRKLTAGRHPVLDLVPGDK